MRKRSEIEAEYLVTKAESKRKPDLNPWHDEILNCPCHIDTLKIGEDARWGVIFRYNPNYWDTFRTTEVVQMSTDEVSGVITVETMNTFYELTPVGSEGVG